MLGKWSQCHVAKAMQAEGQWAITDDSTVLCLFFVKDRKSRRKNTFSREDNDFGASWSLGIYDKQVGDP